MRQGRSPRYVVIEDAVRRMIDAGRPGDRIPSDGALAARFGVSRMTARQATQNLTNEGALYRLPGVGTFVAAGPIHRPVSKLQSFSEEMRERGLRPRSRILSATTRAGSEPETMSLRLRPGDRVVHVRRLRLAADNPIAVQDTVLPLTCSGVLDADLAAGSLHDALRAIGRIPAYGSGSLGAVPADPEHAGILGVPEGAPLLMERLLVVDQNGDPVEFAETRYAGGRYEFDLELVRAGMDWRPA